jgi:hypothetical protein
MNEDPRIAGDRLLHYVKHTTRCVLRQVFGCSYCTCGAWAATRAWQKVRPAPRSRPDPRKL